MEHVRMHLSHAVNLGEWTSHAHRIVRAASLLVLGLSLLLAACGSQIGPTTVGTHASASVTSTSQSTSAKGAAGGVPVMQPQSIVFNGDGLHIEVALTCEQFDVLAADRLTYDRGEVQAIENYFFALLQPGSTPKPPTTVVVASGGKTCTAKMELTNTGSSSIIVKQVDVRLLSAPLSNTYVYRLIDYCSLPLDGGDCYTPHGGGPECNTYSASIQLSSASVGSVFSGTPMPSDPSCPSQLIVSPGPSAMILDVGFSSGNFEYSTELHLEITSSDGKKDITLSRSPSTLVFAVDSQFSCYSLHGTKFSLEFQGSAAYKRTDGDFDSNHFCV